MIKIKSCSKFSFCSHNTMRTCFVRITDRAADALSGVRCVLVKPLFKAAFSICKMLIWTLVKPAGLGPVHWLCPELMVGFWLTAGWDEGDLRKDQERKTVGRRKI